VPIITPWKERATLVASGELALVISGASGGILAAHFAAGALATGAVEVLHVVVTGPGGKVLAHELGAEWGSPRGFRDQLPVSDELRSRIRPWTDSDLTAPIASGSHPLAGVVVLPCSAGMAGSLAHGISRGLSQRVADVALKQRWPLVLGIRETPMSPILLDNLSILARIGVHIVPPLPAFYLKPEAEEAFDTFVDHYVVRVLDLLGIPAGREDLRWGP
jgi:4-hydroxy-3-polyprenylbenzoate decarboxylase